LEHDNIVKLFGICYEPVSMVMEYVPRGDLHRLLVSTQMAHVACSHPSHDHIKPIGGLSPAPVKLGTPHSVFSHASWLSSWNAWNADNVGCRRCGGDSQGLRES
jgi:serine/threonine protein kinase